MFVAKTPDFLMQVGENIARIRQGRGMSMEKLGLEVGLTRSHIHRIENGYNITLLTLLKLSVALKVEPHKLIKTDKEIPKKL